MKPKYIAFDIETAKVLPEQVTNLQAHRPLGICCAAALTSPEEKPRFWYGGKQDSKPAPRMTKDEAAELVRDLEQLVQGGFTIVTWNGLGFDFDILAEESGLRDECRRLARSHVDMMFYVFCQRGYPISLDSAATGMALAGKSATVQSYMAPALWAEGRTDEVLAYVGQDVRATLELALKCEKKRVLRWIAKSGKLQTLPLKSGWMSVDRAMRLPPPDTSWMKSPIPRSRFTGWLEMS